jgi:hypothetical protein
VSLSDANAVAECLGLEHACGRELVRESAFPRIRELYGILGIDVP